MNRTNKILAGGLWGCLGMYRGNQFYNKDYKDCQKFSEYILPTHRTRYYYSRSIGCTIVGAAIYCYPIFVPMTIMYELYNLENYIRFRSEGEVELDNKSVDGGLSNK